MKTPVRFMGQDWKTLSLVVLGAAVAGWLMVRVLSGGSSGHDLSPTAVAPAPARSAEAVDADEAEPPAAADTAPAPARNATAPAPPPVAAGEGDTAFIERDLQALADALAHDQRLEDRLMPRINDALDVPGVVQYRREPDFWEPAFASSGGAMR